MFYVHCFFQEPHISRGNGVCDLLGGALGRSPRGRQAWACLRSGYQTHVGTVASRVLSEAPPSPCQFCVHLPAAPCLSSGACFLTGSLQCPFSEVLSPPDAVPLPSEPDPSLTPAMTSLRRERRPAHPDPGPLGPTAQAQRTAVCRAPPRGRCSVAQVRDKTGTTSWIQSGWVKPGQFGVRALGINTSKKDSP